MFRASNARIHEDTVIYMQHMVLSLSLRGRGKVVGGCLKTPPNNLPLPLIESDGTICCMYITVSS